MAFDHMPTMALIMPPRDDGEQQVQELIVPYNSGHVLDDPASLACPDVFDPHADHRHQGDVRRPAFDPRCRDHACPVDTVRDGSHLMGDFEYHQNQVLPSSNSRRPQRDDVPPLHYPAVEDHALLHNPNFLTYHELYPSASWNQAIYDPACRVEPSYASEEYRAALARQSDTFLASAFSLSFADNSHVPSAPHDVYAVGPTEHHRSYSPQPPVFKRKREGTSNDFLLGEEFGTDAAEPSIGYRQFKRSPSSSPGARPLHDVTFKSPRLSEAIHSPALHGLETEQPPRTAPPSTVTQHPVPSERSPPRTPALKSGTGTSLVVTIKTATGPHHSCKPTMSMKPNARIRGDKKQALACLFCRERKIACGRPPADSPDRTCNQCARRRLKCDYPTESRRGQHKRIRRTETSAPTATTST